MQHRDYGHYRTAVCGGLMETSGKGSGPRGGRSRQRSQTIHAFPAWCKRGNLSYGTDLYFSSRWDNSHQVYDHFWTPKDIGSWWESETWDYVFVQEVGFHLVFGDFEWAGTKTPSAKTLLNKCYWQWYKAQVKNRRGRR